MVFIVPRFGKTPAAVAKLVMTMVDKNLGGKLEAAEITPITAKD
jgi:hypothetical protein